MPALLAIALGIMLGLASGGNLKRLSLVRLKFETAILVLFVVQGAARGRLLGLGGPTHVSLSAWLISTMALVVFLTLNWRIPGAAIGALGALINLDVVLANGAMPILTTDGTAAVAMRAVANSGGFYKVAIGPGLSSMLGDSMPLRLLPGLSLQVSVGDVLLAVGTMALIVFAMTTQPDRHVLRSSPIASSEGVIALKSRRDDASRT